MKTILLTIAISTALSAQSAPAPTAAQQLANVVTMNQNAIGQLGTALASLDSMVTALGTAQAAVAGLGTPDPTVAMNQAAGLYVAMTVCSNTPGCVPVAFLYTCPGPGPWQATTTYLMGSKVTDASGNIYTLTAVAAGGTASGAATPVWNTTGANPVTVDGPYTWTLTTPAGVASVCAAQTTQTLTAAK